MATEKIGTAVLELTTDSTKFVKGVEDAEKAKTRLSDGFKVLSLELGAVNKLADSFIGANTIKRAEEYAAAIDKAGGATKLIASDQARANTVFTEAYERMKVLGQGTSDSALRFQRLAEATKQVEPAVRSLTAAEQELARSQERINALGAQFGGGSALKSADEYAKAVSQVGGAAKLTAAEQQQVNQVVTTAIAKYQALGQTAPAHLTKLADATKQTTMSTGLMDKALDRIGPLIAATFTVGAITNWVKSTVEAGSHIADLADKLAVSTDAVQRWSYATSLSGGTIDDVSQALAFMNKTLGGGDKSTIESLEKAGLRFADIRAMKPEDAFNAIATAIKNIPDPMTQSRIATELFGRGAAVLLPAIRDGIVEVGKSASVMSKETIAALDKAGDTWTKFGNKVTVLSADILSWLVELASHPIQLIQQGLMQRQVAMMGELVDGINAHYMRRLDLSPEEKKKAIDLAHAMADAWKKTAEAGTGLSGVTVTVGRAMTAQNQAANEMHARLAAITAEVDRLTKSERAQIVADEAAGATAKELAAAYAVSEDAIGRVVAAHRAGGIAAKQAASDTAQLWKEWAKHIETASETVAALDKLNARLGNTTLAATPAEIATAALAVANRQLTPEVTAAAMAMLQAGFSADEVFKKLKAGHQVVDDDRMAIDKLKDVVDEAKKSFADFDRMVVENKGLNRLLQQLPSVTLRLSAAETATKAVTDAARRLDPAVIKAAESMLKAGLSADEVTKRLKEQGLVTDEDKSKIEALVKTHGTWIQSLGTLAQSFATLAQIAGESFSGLAKVAGIGASSISLIGKSYDDANKALKAWNEMSKHTSSDVLTLASSYAQTAVSVFSVASALNAYFDAQSKANRLAADSAAGQKDLREAFASANMPRGQVVQRPTFSDDLASKVNKDYERAMAFATRGAERLQSEADRAAARAQAVALNLSAAIAEIGGLTSKNLVEMEVRALPLFDLIARKGKIGQDAQKELNSLVGQFADQAEKSGGVWDEALQLIITKAKSAGIEIDALNKLAAGQQTKLAAGASGATAAIGLQAAKYLELKAAIEAADKAGDPEAKAKAQDALSKAVVTTQGEFDRLSRIELRAYNALVASGVDPVTAIGQMGAGIDALITNVDAFGLAGNEAFDKLKRWRTLTTENAPLLTQIGNLNDLLVASANLNQLDQEGYADLAAQGVSTYQQLLAAFTPVNASEEQARQARIEAETAEKPFLENIIRLHQEKGLAIDEETQKIIDQATADGVLSGQQLSTQQILKDGLGVLIGLLGGQVPDAWKTAADKAAEAAKRMKDDLDRQSKEAATKVNDNLAKVRPDIAVDINYYRHVYGDAPPEGGDEGPAPGPGPDATPQFMRGTGGQFLDFGPRGMLVTLHNRERIVTEDEVKKTIPVTPYPMPAAAALLSTGTFGLEAAERATSSGRTGDVYINAIDSKSFRDFLRGGGSSVMARELVEYLRPMQVTRGGRTNA